MTLEEANIKLASVVSDVMGRSARDMLAAFLAGEVDPVILAELARGRMRATRDLLVQALQGQLKSHHCFLIGEQLADIDTLNEAIEHMSTEIAERLRPYEHKIPRLLTIPGIRATPGRSDLSRDGTGHEPFPCPGNNESGGKRLGGKTRHPVTDGSVLPEWKQPMLLFTVKTPTSLREYQRLVIRRGARRRQLRSDTRFW